MAIALWLCAPAQAEVYKCEDPELGVTYQQTPCPEPKAEEVSEPAEAEEEVAEPAAEPAERRSVVRRDQSVEDVVAAEQEQQARREEVEACKQQYRDAIDAIDLEIQNSYTPEQRDYYLGRLKALTDKMAAC
ncbi:MAG: DUF4124 domain-containing protein [Woeseiaceae bacterium]|nr:DUF4124 domain-containing protein [Woeseiaceae bacterium]